ncbi:MAG: ecotin family protein [Burkholderiales bacterium]
MTRLLFAGAFALALAGPAWSASDDLKAFPAAEPGSTRFVIRLPKGKDEAALKVELRVGKTVRTDAANRYFFGGTLEAVTIEGWGFTRYVLRELGPMAGTLMAVEPNAPQVDRFVALGGEPKLVRYNSRLPLVVYVPDGVEVRYRVWRAAPAFSSAGRG